MFNASLKVDKEEFEDTQGVIRFRKSEEAQTAQWRKEKVQKDKY